MNKEELLQELRVMTINDEVGRDEITQLFGIPQTPTPHDGHLAEETAKHHSAVTNMLYVLGASVVVIGIISFMAQIWDDMGSSGRILITFGLGFLMALLGSILLQTESNLGIPFHSIGGILIPAGMIVALVEMNIATDWALALIFVAISAFYFVLSYVHKKAILAFLTIANGTAAAYLLLNAFLEPLQLYQDVENELQDYLTMILGVSYIIIARLLKGGWNIMLTGYLNFFGITGFLGAIFLKVLDYGVGELFYFIVLFGALFVSVRLKSRIVLIVSTLFLIAHVMYVASEYFGESLGWPVALVLLGFMFIGLGYASIAINNKYIK